MTTTADPTGGRIARMLPGRSLGRLATIHALHSASESMFAVSLAGSLFFSVSLDASRSRILLYLALTLAPFAVLGPLIGPFLDKVRGGHRAVMATTLAGRAVLVLGLSGQIQTLWLYPIAFGMLVVARTYSVTRNAIVPAIVPEQTELVQANATIALVGNVAGGLASAGAVGILAVGGSPWLLRAAALPYLLGAVATLGLPDPRTTRFTSADIAEIADPEVSSTADTMALVRAAVGYLTFHLGFVLKSTGAATWFFGLAIVANGVGAVAGTLAAPRLRRRLSEQQMLTLAVSVPAALAAIAALRFHEVTIVAASAAMGSGMSVARRAFDSVIQSRAPHASRGSAYAFLETKLEIAWVVGALGAVVGQAAGWIGMAVLAGALGTIAITRVGARRFRRRIAKAVGAEPLPRRILSTAEHVAAVGDHLQAVALAAAAADACLCRRADRAGADEITELRARLHALRDLTVASPLEATSARSGEAIAITTRVLDLGM